MRDFAVSCYNATLAIYPIFREIYEHLDPPMCLNILQVAFYFEIDIRNPKNGFDVCIINVFI